jgi:hypothetical protein
LHPKHFFPFAVCRHALPNFSCTGRAGARRTLDGVANPDADTHGKVMEASRRPQRIRKPQQSINEYDF